MTKLPIDTRSLTEISDVEPLADREPPAALAAYSRLGTSLTDIGAAAQERPGDATKRAVLDQLASQLGDLPR